MKKKLLLISILATYFLLSWGIGSNKEYTGNEEVDSSLTVVSYANEDLKNDQNYTDFEDYQYRESTNESVETNSTNPLNNFKWINSPEDYDNQDSNNKNNNNNSTNNNNISVISAKNNENVAFEQAINATEINPDESYPVLEKPPDKLDSSIYTISTTKQPIQDIKLDSYVYSVTTTKLPVQDISAEQETNLISDAMQFEKEKSHLRNIHKIIQNFPKSDHNSTEDSKLITTYSKVDSFQPYHENAIRTDFYPHYDDELFTMPHPHHKFVKKRKRPKKTGHPVFQHNHFMPIRQFSMHDGRNSYMHEIPHYDVYGPNLPLPPVNFEPPPYVIPMRNDPGNFDHFPPNLPHLPVFKDGPIYFRPYLPGYLIKCKTNSLFAFLTRRTCIPQPIFPHI